MTIWHRRRRRGTKASWIERRGECAIALTCKWGFVTELKLPDPLYPPPPPKKTSFFKNLYSVTNGAPNSGLCICFGAVEQNCPIIIGRVQTTQLVFSAGLLEVWIFSLRKQQRNPMVRILHYTVVRRFTWEKAEWDSGRPLAVVLGGEKNPNTNDPNTAWIILICIYVLL